MLKSLVTRYQGQFKTTLIYGVPLMSLSEDELRAALIESARIQAEARRDHSRALNTLAGPRK